MPVISPAPSTALPLDTANVPKGTFRSWMDAVHAYLTGTREVLAANRTYFVRTDGSDSNTGLADTAGGAFLTIQAAVNASLALDANGFTATVQVRDGTFTAGVALTRPMLGGFLEIVGNTTTPANCIISTSGVCISASGPGVGLTVRGLSLVSSGQSHISLSGGARVVVNGAMRYGAVGAGRAHINVVSALFVQNSIAETIVAGATAHIAGFIGAAIEYRAVTSTLTGTPAFSSGFAFADTTSVIFGDLCSFSGAATGPRYSATLNGVINVGGAGANYFPGNSAGATATGGQYS